MTGEYAILIGAVVSLLMTELLGIAPGGVIVPGYLALYLPSWDRIALTLLDAVIVLGIYRFLSSRLVLFGKRRYAVFLILGFLVRFCTERFLWTVLPEHPAVRAVGWLVPGVLALEAYRQGVVRTLGATAVGTLAVALVLSATAGNAYRPFGRPGTGSGPGTETSNAAPRAKAAAELMRTALEVLRREAERRGIRIDPSVDENRTGIIGVEFSGITTTLGDLRAKRTGAHPNAAVLMVRLLEEAGIGREDRVAVDGSGSFPGFVIASLIAAETLGADPALVLSLGSSSWGANRPEFTLPDMVEVLKERGIVRTGPLVVTPGGNNDRGEGMDPLILRACLERARAYGAAIVVPSSLREAVEVRTRTFGIDSDSREEKQGEAREPSRATGTPPPTFSPAGPTLVETVTRLPKVLISLGGNYASTGAVEFLPGRNGLIHPQSVKDDDLKTPGLIQTFLRKGVPVVRVLDIRSLCGKYGLPFDPK